MRPSTCHAFCEIAEKRGRFRENGFATYHAFSKNREKRGMRRKTDRAAYHANIRNAEKRGCPSGFKLHENQPGEGAAPPVRAERRRQKAGSRTRPGQNNTKRSFQEFSHSRNYLAGIFAHPRARKLRALCMKLAMSKAQALCSSEQRASALLIRAARFRP